MAKWKHFDQRNIFYNILGIMTTSYNRNSIVYVYHNFKTVTYEYIENCYPRLW